MKRIIVSNDLVGERLDKALSSMFPEYSRSAIEKLIESGEIQVNATIAKTKHKLREGDEITLNFSELDREVDEIELPILYEDENVVVINKPVGILSHSKGAFNKEGTVANWLKKHCSTAILNEVEGSGSKKSDWILNQITDDKTSTQDDKPYDVIPAKAGTSNDFWNSNRAGIVHRLDRATSGVMICAKNEATFSHLGKQFSDRNVKKTYLAVISGALPEESGIIDVPIERNPKKPATFRAGINGKGAQTSFKVKNSFARTNNKGDELLYSLVELSPKTGRTHQLRVHMNYLKHPIVGDEFYDGEKAERLMLHAAKLEITVPGSKRMTFEAPVPAEFNKLVS